MQYHHCITHPCRHGEGPSYVASQPADFEARRPLRSASSTSLIVRRTRLSTIGDRACPVAACRVWIVRGCRKDVGSGVHLRSPGLLQRDKCTASATTCIGDCSQRSMQLMTRTRRHEHITPVLKERHWLPVRLRVEFKLASRHVRTVHDAAWLGNVVSVRYDA